MPEPSPLVAWMSIPRAPHIQDRRFWCLSIALSLAGFSLYVLYKQDSVASFSSKVRRVVRAGRNAVDLMTRLTEISQTLLIDLQSFLASEDTTLPVSLRQISALFATGEFRQATRSLVMTFFEGLAAGGGGQQNLDQSPVFENLVERIVVRATRRPDLMSIAIRLATRNSVDELLSMLGDSQKTRNGSASHLTTIDAVLSRVSTENGRRVMATAVTAFTSTFVSVCIEKAKGETTWDEIFRVISRPHNFRLVQQLVSLSSREFARGCVDQVSHPSQHQPLPPIEIPEITPDESDTPPFLSPRSPPTPQHEVSSLMESFLRMARDEECRKVLYQFVGCALAEMVKALLKDAYQWCQQRGLKPLMKYGWPLFWEFFVFCCIPMMHCLSTSLSIQAYPLGA